MDPLALGLILISAFFHSIWNVLAKRSLDKHAFFWWMLVFEVIMFIPICLYLFLARTITSIGWFLVVSSGIVHFGYWVTLSSSYMLADLSIVYPIARSAPLFVTLFAVLFFNETLTWWGFMGILSVLSGVYLLTLNFPDDKKRISAVSSFKNKGLLFAFFTALTVTAYSLIDKQGAQHLHPILYVWTMNGVALIPLTLLIVFTKQEQASIEWKQNKWPILVSSFLNLLSYSLIIFVMQTYQVSYIVSIRQISVIFGVIFGGTVLKERNIKSRLLFSILIFAGLFLISLS